MVRRFHVKWSQAITNCGSLHDLEQVIDQLVIDWRAKSSWVSAPNSLEINRRKSQCIARVSTASGVTEPHTNTNTRVANGRSQNRKIQRARKQRKFNDRDASRLQHLFRSYPRRAVRQILDHAPPKYGGSLAEAEEFLRATYEKEPPTPADQIIASRETYDDCRWQPLEEAESEELNCPPPKEEIEWKLRKATNTAPGGDKLEYQHLRALDPKDQLLATLYAAAWRWGIPKLWKESRTISIHKKGSIDDLGNFRTISHLPTIYKISSAIICQRLARLAAEKSWISPAQKGFLPGIQGIQ